MSAPNRLKRPNKPQSLRISVDELQGVWGTIGQAGSETRVRASGTIVPLDRSDAAVLGAISEKLPRLSMDANKGPIDLMIGEVIGEGAMGIVRLAEQVPVSREVAVKTVRPEAVKQNAHVELLREGWVTGRLEHPNIVPIYGIGRDSDDMPLLVMKRIEGTTWHELIHTPDHPVIAASGRSNLAFHLGKLIQVCNAVHFAHSRGIVHRDLKPENVMIGEFGEVYVLDWGIAVSLEHDTMLPRACDVTTVAGTPDYMAPEMTTGDGGLLTVQTDVFLLGALLHEVITGAPPNDGDSLFDKIYAAARCDPKTFGSQVDDELAGVARKAMEFEPEGRYPTVAALRDAIARYMGHMSSRELAVEAQGRFEAMRYLLGDTPGELDAEEQIQLNNLFSEARFGFKQALRTWAENPLAKRGLQRAIETMVGYELRRGATSSAEAVLAELPERRPHLDTRLDELRQRKAEEEQRLIRMDLAMDDSTSGTSIAAVTTGLLFISLGIGYFILSVLDSKGALDVDYEQLLVLAGGGAAFVALVRLVAMKSLATRRVARRMLNALLVVSLAWSAQWLIAFLLPADVHTTVRESIDETTLHAILMGWAGFGVCGFAFDSRFLGPALCFFALQPIALVETRYAMDAFGAACLLSALTVAVLWRSKLSVEDPDAL